MKFLCIIFLCSAAILTDALEKTICEPMLDTISCPTGLIIQVDDVLYGRTQNNVCNPNNNNIQNLNCRSTQTSSSSVRASCQSRTTCLVQADNGFMGEDPCPTTPKYLTVKYQCVVTIQPSQPGANPVASTPATTTTPTATTTTPLTTTFPTTVVPVAGSPTPKSNQTSGQFCHEYLVSGPRGVPDGQLSSSSRLSLRSNAHRARLFQQIDKYPNGFSLEGGWTADSNDKQPWIQVKMNWLTIVTGITTQGRHVNPDTGCCQEWTTHYTVEYSIDGVNWETVSDDLGRPKVFIGNTDTDTPISHMFDCPVTARYLKIEIQRYHSQPSLRFEVLGCPTNSDDVGNCPKGWKERPSSDTCYYISDQADKKFWENAMLTCKRQQGNLVKIDSLQEKAWLRGELQSLQQSQKLNEWWVGLNNRPRFDNNYYTWEDASTLDTSVLQWTPGEPNNVGGKEHCAQYVMTSDSLNDKDCDTPMPYICELQKYWLQPVNKPGLVTLQPTIPTTQAPSTVANKVPIPIGGNLVTSGQSTFTTGCLQQSDCAGKAWNNYPSCSGCGFYLTCAPSGSYIRNCPLNLKYDANVDACTQRSSTCQGP